MARPIEKKTGIQLYQTKTKVMPSNEEYS